MPHIVQLLVEVGQADVQVRATKTGKLFVDIITNALNLFTPAHVRSDCIIFYIFNVALYTPHTHIIDSDNTDLTEGYLAGVVN